MTIKIGDKVSDGEIVKVGHTYKNGNTRVWIKRADGTINKNRQVAEWQVIVTPEPEPVQHIIDWLSFRVIRSMATNYHIDRQIDYYGWLQTGK